MPAVVARLGGDGPGRERGLVGRVGGRTAGGRPERADHARGRGQDCRRPAGGGAGRGRRENPCAGSRWRARRSWPRSDRSRDGRGLGRAGSPPLDVLLRLNPDVHPETHAGLAVGHGASKFGMTETELTGAVAGLPADGPLRARGVHLHVGSQLGAVDAWRDAVRRGLAVLALVGAGRPDFDTLRRGWRVPGRRARDGADARAVRAGGRAAAGGDPGGTATAAPGRGARPVPGRAGGVARGERPPRPRTRRSRRRRGPGPRSSSWTRA